MPDPAESLLDSFRRIEALVELAFAQASWADDEVAHAIDDHPAHRDSLWHAKSLLTPTADIMRTEFVYRSHCRQLLARVVSQGDTRLPTDAEIAAACSETSLHAPLSPGGATVYMRAFARAFPDKADVLSDQAESYEVVGGTSADALERRLRKQLMVPERTLAKVSCSGRHGDEPAPRCRFFTPEQLHLDLPHQ